MPEPLVSVVVSTYNRPARLAALLDSLRAQTLEPAQFEVIVVDNGSHPPLGDPAAAGLRLRCLRNELTRGPAAARNQGWRLARAPLIAFTDDDCRVDERWLETALERHRADPEALVQGRTEPDPLELDRLGLLSRTQRIERLGPQFETCNVFYPRALLERLDGFDERFGIEPAGEDTDLAWRALGAGAGAVFAPEAIAYHAVERVGVRGQLRVAGRWGAVTRIYRSHPETRAMLYRGVFWNVWHYLLWRSLLALALPRWLRRPLMRRHFAELRRRAAGGGARGAALAWALPFLLAYDAVECWAIARGAIRHRTLVL